MTKVKETTINLETLKTLEEMAATIAKLQAAILETENQKPKEQPKTRELNANQKRVIQGVLDRASKKGAFLGYYIDGSWVWFYDKPKAKAEKTEPKATKSPELKLVGKLSTKHTLVKWSKNRGQFFITDFLK